MPRRCSHSAPASPFPASAVRSRGHDLDQHDVLLQRIVHVRRSRRRRNREPSGNNCNTPGLRVRVVVGGFTFDGRLTATGTVLAASFNDTRQLMIQAPTRTCFPTDQNQVQDWVRFTTAVNGSLAWSNAGFSLTSSFAASGRVVWDVRCADTSHALTERQLLPGPAGGQRVRDQLRRDPRESRSRTTSSARRSPTSASTASDGGGPGRTIMFVAVDPVVVSRRRTPDGERYRADSVTSVSSIHRRPPRTVGVIFRRFISRHQGGRSPTWRASELTFRGRC